MKTLLEILLVVLACSMTMHAEAIDQKKVDRVVDEEIALYYHHEDAASAIEALKKEGATQEMLVSSFAKILRRDLNSGLDEPANVRMNSAIYWFGEMASQDQLTNLVFVAETATNNHARTALFAYHRHCRDKARFVEICRSCLRQKKMEPLHWGIWNCLEQELNGPHRESVLKVAMENVSESDLRVLYADRLLVRTRPEYKKSFLRKAALKRILENKSFKKTWPKIFDRVNKEYEQLEVR